MFVCGAHLSLTSIFITLSTHSCCRELQYQCLFCSTIELAVRAHRWQLGYQRREVILLQLWKLCSNFRSWVRHYLSLVDKRHGKEYHFGNFHGDAPCVSAFMFRDQIRIAPVCMSFSSDCFPLCLVQPIAPELPRCTGIKIQTFQYVS